MYNDVDFADLIKTQIRFCMDTSFEISDITLVRRY